MIRYSKKLKQEDHRMKGLLKRLVTPAFIGVSCLIAYFLFLAMKGLYIESWFVLNRSVVIGFLSGLIVTFLIAFSNFTHTQRAHARDRAASLDLFQMESSAFLALVQGFSSEQGKLIIPQSSQLTLGAALARLEACANSILRCERVSPLKYSVIQKRGALASPIARAEREFDLAFEAFEETCVAAYHTHSSIPYLTSEPERQAAQGELQRHLQQVLEQLDPQSALSKAQRDYRSRIDRLFGIRQARPDSAA
jgi:hypothetical protein